MRRATATVLLTTMLLAGCGSGDADESDDVAAPSTAPSPTADPKGDWLSAMAGLCNSLSGAVSGQIIRDGMDGKYTPEEVLAGDKAAQPAVAEFDKGFAALTVPPEAAEAHKAFTDLRAKNASSVAALLAAAQAGDQAKMNAVFAEREKLRLSPEGIPSLTKHGLPEKCNYRNSYG